MKKLLALLLALMMLASTAILFSACDDDSKKSKSSSKKDDDDDDEDEDDDEDNDEDNSKEDQDNQENENNEENTDENDPTENGEDDPAVTEPTETEPAVTEPEVEDPTVSVIEDMVTVVQEAYRLQAGESMDRNVILYGTIISLDTVYNAEHQNITVTIAVDGAEDMPIKCYRLIANEDTEDVLPDLLVGNLITVSGIIKNYNGIIEFDAGCTLLTYEIGDAVVAPTDIDAILKAAYNLDEGEALPYAVTLTGTVIDVNTLYNPDYDNVSVTIEIDGYPQYPIFCYRMTGNGADEIVINHEITVTGIIKNYNGTIEFDIGCQLISFQ